MTAPIDFYFDFSSPYGYFASTQIDDLAARYQRTVIWRPILLGIVFKVTGSQPLVSIPLKREYVQRDLARYSRLFNVPFNLPSKFPIASQAPARAFYSMSTQDPNQAKELARVLLRAYFVEDLDISSPSTTVDIAQRHGFDGPAM